MIKKKLTKLIGLKKEDFDLYISSGQIQLQPARLIPTLKTGDEMALTSIFLSSLKLIKEYRDSIFKEIKLSRSGKIYYYTEACFIDVSPSRIDGLIITVSKGVISDAAFFEMKNKSNNLTEDQITDYLNISKTLKVDKLVTVSNDFVAEPTISPLNIKIPKAVTLYHFSWTYLVTKGQILLFNNDTNIEDTDQIEIMKEVLHYFEHPVSGIKGYTQMKAGWKELSENVRATKPLSPNDEYISDAILSWHEEESDIALLLSRKLGVLVKPSSKGRDLKLEVKKVIKDQYLNSSFTIKDSVSDLKMRADFASRVVSMTVKVTAPQDKGAIAQVTWLNKQLENCKKKSEDVFSSIQDDLWIEVDIRYVKSHIKVNLKDIGTLTDLVKGKDIQGFNIVVVNSFGMNFSSVKKFVEIIEQKTLDFYEGVVQHLSNWTPKAPKIVED